jgi:hypothetical protein
MGIDAAKGFLLPHFKKFWRFLGRSEGGSSIKRNFLRDQNILKSTAEQFTARVAKIVGEGRGGRPSETLRLAIMEDPPLTLCGRTSSLAPGDMLVRWELLYDINKRLSGVSGGSSRDLKSLEDDIQAGIFTLLDGLKLGNGLGIVWCTLAPEIDKAMSKGDTIGRVCDRMGLSHICWGTVIEFRYPVSSLSKLRIPTTLDAFDSPDFRPSGRRGATGHTMDIQTGGRGLPEMVHEGRLLLDLKSTVSFRGER